MSMVVGDGTSGLSQQSDLVLGVRLTPREKAALVAFMRTL